MHKCLDFGVQFNELNGERMTPNTVPINKSVFSKIGASAFKECVKFVANLPHVKELNLALCEELSSSIYWHVKETLISIVWGELFQSLFPKFFMKLEIKKGKNTLQDLQLKKNVYVTSFKKADLEEFLLTEAYSVSFNNGETMTVLLQEQNVIKAIYMDPEF